jgi:hypothetical protein
MNKNYINGNPFIMKEEGLPVESVNLFIMMGGLLEGTIDVNVPEHFQDGVWFFDEVPQKARFCKFALANMSGENNNNSLKFNTDQGALIQVQIFMQLLDRIETLEIEGVGLEDLNVNVLKKYPATNQDDVIINDLDLNEPFVNILDSQLEHDTFYLELYANADNITLENIKLTIKTKKLAGTGELSIDGNLIYIDGDRHNTLPIYTQNEFQDMFEKYVKRDLETVQEATDYLEDPETPDGAIVLLPKNAL